MGRIYEDIVVEGKKVKAKADTGSDFPLALRMELIRELGLEKHPTIKASVIREENGKTIKDLEPTWTADIKIQKCRLTVPVVEAKGENLIGNTLLQRLKTDIDIENDKMTVRDCPTLPWSIDGKRRIFELMGDFVMTGYCGGKTGEIVNI